MWQCTIETNEITNKKKTLNYSETESYKSLENKNQLQIEPTTLCTCTFTAIKEMLCSRYVELNLWNPSPFLFIMEWEAKWWITPEKNSITKYTGKLRKYNEIKLKIYCIDWKYCSATIKHKAHISLVRSSKCQKLFFWIKLNFNIYPNGFYCWQSLQLHSTIYFPIEYHPILYTRNRSSLTRIFFISYENIYDWFTSTIQSSEKSAIVLFLFHFIPYDI